MRINHNIAALNTYRQLSSAGAASQKNMSKLSSGLRINSAADDAAGLAISEKMRNQIRGLDQASRNAQDGVSLIQTAEGGLTEIHSILQRMRELAVQSSTGTNTDADRTQINSEFQALSSEITDIGNQTKFNGINLIDGSFGTSVNLTTSTADNVTGVKSVTSNGAAETYTITDGGAGSNLTVADAAGNTVTVIGGGTRDGAQTIRIEQFDITITTDETYTGAALNTRTVVVSGAGGTRTIQTGANSGETINIGIGDMRATGLGINASTVATSTGADAAITALDTAITSVATQRATNGAAQNRLEHRLSNLGTSSENLTAAESRIRDVDMAKEMMEFTKNNIINQAAQAMLAQANQLPQQVLQLLR